MFPHNIVSSMKAVCVIVELNRLFRHGVSGGSNRGPGESAAGPRRRPGGHHHLLMMEMISDQRKQSIFHS